MNANRTRKVLIFIFPFLLASPSLSPCGPRPHRSLDRTMEKITEYASRRNALALPLCLFLLGREREFETAQAMVISLGLSAGTAAALKQVVGRKRPTPPTKRSNSSFPSGHATVAFAAASTIGHAYPRLAVPAYLLAGTVAYSRIYLKRHYPTDVLAGALLGWVSAKLVWRYRERITLQGTGLIGALAPGKGPSLSVVMRF